MKSAILSTTPRFTAGRASLLAALALLLPACSLERRPLVAPQHVYVVGAMVRTSAGVVPIAGDDLLFAGAASARVFATGDGSLSSGETSRDRILSEWRRYLRRRLEDPAASPEFRARFGNGPFCLLATEVRRTEPVATTLPEPESGPELDDCGPTAAPIACATPAGTAPRLEISMPSIEFGPRPVGVLSADTSIVISNAGTGRLCLDAPALDASLSSELSDFTLVAGDCLPGSDLEREAGLTFLDESRPSCMLQVRFQPSASGLRSAVLRVSGSDPDRPVAYAPVQGTGQPGTLRPSASPFCAMTPVTIGTGLCYRDTLSFTNDGPGVVTVSSLALPTGAVDWLLGGFVPSRPSFTLAPGASMSFVARVCNTGAATTVTIGSNADVPVTIVSLTSLALTCIP